MPSADLIVALIVYAMVGLLVWGYLYATWDGWTADRQEGLERAGCLMIVIPEAGIVLALVILCLWPVFLLGRAVQHVFRGGQS